MQESRRELVDQVLRLVGETDDADARTLAEDLVNIGLLRIWMKHPWRSFRMPAQYEFTTTADTRSYPLPQYFGRIPPPPAKVRNLTTGGEIEVWSIDDVQSAFPAQGTSLEVAGPPQRCFISGSVGVGTQPSSAGDALEVLSTSAADTTVRVTVEGLDASGRDTRAQVTLTGVTAVAIGTWTKILSFSKAYPDGTTPTNERTSSVGNVSLRKVTGGTVLQLLLPMESAVDRPEITLHPVPSTTGQTISVPVLRVPKRLIYDADMIPAFWTPALRDYMIRNWRVSTGELTEEGDRPYPALLDLIAFDSVQGGATPGRRGSAGSLARY